MRLLLPTLLKVCEMQVWGILTNVFTRVTSCFKVKANRRSSLSFRMSRAIETEHSTVSFPGLLYPLCPVRALASTSTNN